MTTNNSIILNSLQIEQKTKRIAFQILENNSAEKEIIIAGIANNGYVFAKKLVKTLQEVSSIKITLCEVLIDKKNPRKEIATIIEKTKSTHF